MLYNAEQVKQMFDEHAVLFYGQEGVTLYDAISLFGKDAFDWAFHLGDHEECFSFFGDPDIGPYEPFVSYSGFCLVATYANLLELQQKHKEAGTTNPLRDISPKQKTAKRKHTTHKVIDICTMLNNNERRGGYEKIRVVQTMPGVRQ